MHWRTGVVSMQGPRPKMEDRYVLLEGAGGLYGGVYDGHGGSEAADAVAAQLHARFFEALAEGLAPGPAFLRAYERVDRAVQYRTCGTTATTFFLCEDRLTVANLGDGRLILVGLRRVEPLTRDHRADDPEERARILGAGGTIESPYVMRGAQGLMVARSLGDKWFSEVGVIATPELTARELTASDHSLVVACDGLWDELDNAGVAAIARAAATPQAAADALAEAVSARGGRDNLTILVVRLAATG